ncbi:leucine-rich repeat domain-containing protein [Listeria seeligeri]|uniref:leucine-rich repeat domain-containing protein n=1 Tax=Listeria seeligeri TaxID=1640 RepID=UPI001BD9F9FC|nr:leucine-rich repeat domain-containing protein [Listeria seeligeri]MBT0175839.1 leucine-rich repeat domain-containing protein [Listeria seeligeri]
MFRKNKDTQQKNWRLWKKGKQWVCGATLFFTVVASPGMAILAAEVNATESPAPITQEAPAVEAPLSGEVVEKEEETTAEGEETSTSEGTSSKQVEETIPNVSDSEETSTVAKDETSTEAVKGIPGPTAISSIFPDPNLAEVVRSKLKKLSVNDTVTQNELNSISSLTVNNKNISNITGMENLIGLKQLYLSGNRFNDLSPLAGLTNLDTLNLSNNSTINTLSPLAGLTNLEALNLSRCSAVSDLRPLSGLTKLTNLNFGATQVSDLRPLSGLGSLTYLQFDNCQVSDISPLASLTSLKDLSFPSNQVSDISSLNDEYEGRLNATYQEIILPEIDWSSTITLTNIVKDKAGNFINPTKYSDGEYIAPSIIYSLPNDGRDIQYSWGEYIQESGQSFSGIVNKAVNQVPVVRILIDNDGSKYTTDDQTLLTETITNGTTAEDMYNYAKDQLVGTNYGLVDARLKGLDCTIVVSDVGVLKKVDTGGASVAEDSSYLPTYEVTGTGDAAKLSVSYQATVGTPPPGYMYVYGKDTAQEIRYSTSTPVTIPTTDTNGNGIPEWRETYTVVQYQKAGGLNPVTPDGSPVPGGRIAIPVDALSGDVIRVPDIIEGSDGKEYVVDSSVDEDATAPGVQITLTDEEQDIPYFDAITSESESSSGSESSSASESDSASDSESSSASESDSESASESSSASESDSESASESSSASESDSESASDSSSASENDSASDSESSSASESDSESASDSSSASESDSESASESSSASENDSASDSESSSASESDSESASDSSSASESDVSYTE